ncbi:MAG: HD domain-containing protein [Gammaproteobacteria bacterium]|nr:HD domain-containing protein [Gammaproteobacteria bacterium]MCP4879151.1 HD domain-containing protein [Gammaproteobacteria bacterium]MDP6165934.1 HD domain-containing protein [Gammaproteobacteria bacterium]
MSNVKPTLKPSNIVEFIGDIFARRGGEEYLGEPVTMAEHMLQGASIAEQNNKSDAVIAAVLLHDIGHFIGEFGTFTMGDTQDRYHEISGAQMLAPFFPPEVTASVYHHVAAKRYLCATKAAYFKRLSPASVHSLNLQGGPMNELEVAEFAQNPYLEEILQVRYLDEAGKKADMQTPTFAHFAPLLQRLVDRHCLHK